MSIIKQLETMENNVYFLGHRDDAELLRHLMEIFKANNINNLSELMSKLGKTVSLKEK